jgi:LEA14-like dessication related protein
MKLFSVRFFIVVFTLLCCHACLPKEDVVFKGVKNIVVEAGAGNVIMLTAEAYFHNPNKIKMKLKEISVDVLVNDKPSAEVKQKLKLKVPAQADFQVPIEARLSLKDLGLLDTIVNLLGGRKYQVQYVGFIRVAVNGVTVKVPINHKEEIRIRF